MSLAEKLIAEGEAMGKCIGQIQLFEDFLGKAVSPDEILRAMPLTELQALHAALRREYEIRFKRG